MKRSLPSEKVSREIAELLENGPGDSEDFLSLLVRKSVQKIVQEALEQEVADYLGRGYYERNAASNKGLRNGYEPKTVKTAEGKVVVDAPQLRNTDETYRSGLLSQLNTISPELQRLAIEMYVRGLSTRDVEDTLKGTDGKPLISKDGVSEITEALSEEYERFCARDLSDYDVVYMFVDAIYEGLRREAGPKEALLCAWAILSNGRKVMLHLELGNKESNVAWRDFFRNMIARGLRSPLLITSDGAPGLLSAINECFPLSKRQRCLVHKLRNIANKLPQAGIEQLMPKIKNALYQNNRQVAMICAQNIIDEFADQYPAAIKCFQDDLENCLNHMDFPTGHQKHLRTTNLLERAFMEQRRRTKVIPRFWDEKSCLKLAYATLIRASQKWRRVKMSEYDLALLRKIRKLYGQQEETTGFLSLKLAA